MKTHSQHCFQRVAGWRNWLSASLYVTFCCLCCFFSYHSVGEALDLLHRTRWRRWRLYLVSEEEGKMTASLGPQSGWKPLLRTALRQTSASLWRRGGGRLLCDSLMEVTSSGHKHSVIPGSTTWEVNTGWGERSSEWSFQIRASCWLGRWRWSRGYYLLTVILTCADNTG